MRILVTGSSGLIGSEVCSFFDGLGADVHGIDNNQRAVFFGPTGDTRWKQQHLKHTLKSFTHHEIDIRERVDVVKLISSLKPDAIVHAAAQPSHDRAATIPFDDFDTNAAGTLNLLEATRQSAATAPFIFMSTNKVYGDRPNLIDLRELDLRWDYADPNFANGISEDLSIDQCLHSLFGASKVAADVMVQEYGRYFGMNTCCLRGGCLTGPSHSGVQLHGFLSYLVKCNIERTNYEIFGYKGKQVRDNIHSLDVARFILEFIKAPRQGEVYNLGGGEQNSCSILEAFRIVQDITSIEMIYKYSSNNRKGDHICYYSDLGKIREHYPDWSITVDLRSTLEQIVDAWRDRRAV